MSPRTLAALRTFKCDATLDYTDTVLRVGLNHRNVSVARAQDRERRDPLGSLCGHRRPDRPWRISGMREAYFDPRPIRRNHP